MEGGLKKCIRVYMYSERMYAVDFTKRYLQYPCNDRRVRHIRKYDNLFFGS